jgi:hypothetical protein
LGKKRRYPRKISLLKDLRQRDIWLRFPQLRAGTPPLTLKGERRAGANLARLVELSKNWENSLLSKS